MCLMQTSTSWTRAMVRCLTAFGEDQYCFTCKATSKMRWGTSFPSRHTIPALAQHSSQEHQEKLMLSHQECIDIHRGPCGTQTPLKDIDLCGARQGHVYWPGKDDRSGLELHSLSRIVWSGRTTGDELHGIKSSPLHLLNLYAHVGNVVRKNSATKRDAV